MEAYMNQEQVKGKFDQVKGKIKETWGKLTDDDIALYNGKQDQFFGKLKESYGLSKEEAQKHLKEMEDAADKASGTSNKAA